MKKPVPYNLVLDYLPERIIIRQSFGMYYIYLDKKIVLILRQLRKNLNFNGLWIATKIEAHASLKTEVPAITGFVLDNGKIHDSGWQLLPESAVDFETAAIRVCELISKGDQRIGKETGKSFSVE
ncbi:MAG: hypothetical protein V4553_17710 [Bacteroidota bacterium]